jgi:hypothetical protein
VVGTWQVRGRDLTDWTATLVLDPDTNAGSFEWLSTEGYSGHELVTWSFDASTGVLRLAGHTMLHPVGNIVLGTYEVRLSDDGTQLLDGTWGPGASGPSQRVRDLDSVALIHRARGSFAAARSARSGVAVRIAVAATRAHPECHCRMRGPWRARNSPVASQ